MESQSPRKTASQDSLDIIDARLSPRKNPIVADEQTNEKVIFWYFTKLIVNCNSFFMY